MRFRHPPATAIIRSSGKIMIFCSVSEEHAAKKSARQCAKALQNIDSAVRFLNYKVVNVLGTSSMPFAIRICDFAEEHPSNARYEPELHPAVFYQLYKPKATIQIFSTGSITVTGVRAVDKISEAIKHVYPLVKAHSRKLPNEATIQKRLARKRNVRRSI